MHERKVYIVDGTRTPFLKAGGPGPFAAADLAVAAGRSLLLRQPFKPQAIDEVVVGCMGPSENEANIARIIGLRLGCGEKVPGYTVQRNCGAGMQALDSAYKDILLGRSDLVLAGGTETMSRAPLLYNRHMVNWFVKWQKAKTFGTKLAVLSQLRPHFFAPIIALLKGLTDPVVNLTMPQTAEKLAEKFSITREQMDAFALQSQQRAFDAQEENKFRKKITLYDKSGKVYANDTGIRAGTPMEKMAKLRSITDKRFGLITAGNSSQVTDGAAMLLLASEEAVKKI